MGITLQWVSVTQSNLCGTFKREKKYNIFLLQSKGSKVREYLCGLLCSADMHCGKRDDVDEVPEKENLKTMQLVKYYYIFFIEVLFCFLTIYFYKLKKKKVNICWLFIPCTYVLRICSMCVSVYKSVCMYSVPTGVFVYVCVHVCLCVLLRDTWKKFDGLLEPNISLYYYSNYSVNNVILFWFLYIFCYLKNETLKRLQFCTISTFWSA